MASMDLNLTKNTLHDIAVNAYKLAMGLQNIAPPQTTPGPSIQYLKEISIKLENVSKQLEALNPQLHQRPL